MIDSFKGEHAFLSNFYPTKIVVDGIVYRSVEHAYQAAKTTDEKVKRVIRAKPYASEAKRLGDTVQKREDWDNIKIGVMKELLDLKFAEGTELAEQLLSTGDEELAEGNWWGDTFWGVCKGKGENHLGKLLMDRRKVLKSRQ